MPILLLYAALALYAFGLPGLPGQVAPAAQAALPSSSVMLTMPLRISVGVDAQGRPVATPAWVAEQVASARELFAPFGVAFGPVDGGPLDAGLVRVETRADRDAFAGRTTVHAIDVFVVESLRDVDNPSQMRRGVHWHARSPAKPVHYVLLVGGAPPTVLAHELGHYFGNPHSPVPDNVMSYERTGARVFFDAVQGRRIASRAREYVGSGELVPVAP